MTNKFEMFDLTGIAIRVRPVEDIAIAVTTEVKKNGGTYWVVWRDNEAISEQDSEQAALNIARSMILQG